MSDTPAPEVTKAADVTAAESKPAAALVPAPHPHAGAMPAGIFVPSNMSEALKFAEMIADSEFVPKSYRGLPGAVVVAMQMGAELGLSPMAALQNIAVVNGRPAVWGDAALAIVLASPYVIDVVEELPTPENEMTARCTVFRADRDPVSRTFSAADATVAGLIDKGGAWQNYPARMIQLRARGFALRDGCPDSLKGLRLGEEAQDLPADEARDTATATGIAAARERLAAAIVPTAGAKPHANAATPASATRAPEAPPGPQETPPPVVDQRALIAKIEAAIAGATDYDGLNATAADVRQVEDSKARAKLNRQRTDRAKVIGSAAK